MNLIRGLLFDNLGLKLVALLLAVVVYLNVYTDRPATMIVSFPLQLTDLSDTLALAGPVPQVVQAEVRGTGKQLIRLRLTEPSVKISLAGVAPGRFERIIDVSDLPLPSGSKLQLERMVSSRTLALDVDRRLERQVPVVVRVEGVPATGAAWDGRPLVTPVTVLVRGPAREVAALDSVRLAIVSIAGRRDTVHSTVRPVGLVPTLTTEPRDVEVTLAIEPEASRRTVVAIESPREGGGYEVSPAHATVVVIGPRSHMAHLDLGSQRVHWSAPPPLADWVGRRVPLRRLGDLPEGAHARLDPDSVVLRHPGS